MVNLQNSQLTPEQAQLLADAYQRHDNQDWYDALLANAVLHVDTLEEAIELADIAYEDNPQPPETTDEAEAIAQEALGNEISGVFKTLGANREYTDE